MYLLFLLFFRILFGNATSKVLQCLFVFFQYNTANTVLVVLKQQSLGIFSGIYMIFPRKNDVCKAKKFFEKILAYLKFCYIGNAVFYFYSPV